LDNIRVITISGEICSGTSSLADTLITLLPGWKRINIGQKFREFCNSIGESIQQVGFLSDDVHQKFDSLQKSMLETDLKIVIESRLAGWLAQGIEGIFKVFCYAPIEVRVERYMKRENVPKAKAVTDIGFRDKKMTEKFMRMYGISDYRSPSFYDLYLDTSTGRPIDLAQVVIEKIRT